jgi:hypothetical protein
MCGTQLSRSRYESLHRSSRRFSVAVPVLQGSDRDYRAVTDMTADHSSYEELAAQRRRGDDYSEGYAEGRPTHILMR